MSTVTPKNTFSIFENNAIYFVTNEELSHGRSDVEMVKEVLKGGVKVIQLRDKVSSRAIILAKAKQIRELTRQYQAIFLINDDPEIALEVGADGVHLGQDDIPIAEVRRLHFTKSKKSIGAVNEVSRKGSNLFIGLSTHNIDEVNQALSQQEYLSRPDYINFGPLFATNTKINDYPPIIEVVKNNDKDRVNKIGKNTELKLNKLTEMIRLVNMMRSPIPFSVMGGVKEWHIPTLSKIGVKSFAMITELTQHPHPSEHAHSLNQIVRSHQLQSVE